MKNILLLLVFVIAVSCSSLKVNTQDPQPKEQYVELGMIGTSQTNLANTTFNTIAIPVLEDKIRVQITSIPFSKSTYKQYRKALENQIVKDTVNYRDSLAIKPAFVKITLLDQTGYVNALNTPSNASVVSSLKTLKNIETVTSVTAVFNNYEMTQLQNAEEVYLITKNHSKYALEVYAKNKPATTVELSRGVVFGYQLTGFCWRKNKKHQITIANLSNKKCQGGTEKNPEKLIKKINYFKFSN